MRKKLIKVLKDSGFLIKETGSRFYFDYSLVFCVIFLISFGLLMVYSASSYALSVGENPPEKYLIQQFRFAVLGMIGMFIASFVDYRWLIKNSKAIYILSSVLSIATSFIGQQVNGQRRWLRIGPISMQPSEFSKAAIIILMAMILTNFGDKRGKKDFLFWVSLYTLPLIGAIALRNLSAGIIIFLIVFLMCFINSKNPKPYIFCMSAAAVGLVILRFVGESIGRIPFLRGYQMGRILIWINPEKYANLGGEQVLNALYAIGSGGMFGRGLGESIQKRKVLAESQNDMIFAVICEELGVVGAFMVILLYAFLLYRLVKIAQNAPDKYASLLVIGVFSHISLQVILNLAVITNTLPNTGVTLPFISYGGTALLTTMLEIGMVLGIARQIKRS